MEAPPMLLTPEQVSERTGISVATLAKRRVSGLDTPPFIRIGSRVFYDAIDLAAWVASLPRQRSTRENPPGARSRRRRDTGNVAR